MGKLLELTGKKFGRLTVIERSENVDNKKAKWRCKCDCGKESIVYGYLLVNGHTKSCGCLGKEHRKNALIKHGMTNTRLFNIWKAIKCRCTNKNFANYKNYGGRGITMCDEWFNSFTAFYNWSMSNGYSEELSIDRIDVNGNYNPSNCRWATDKEQANNTRKNVFITYNIETHTLKEWAEITGINYSTLHSRIHKLNWTAERALTTK